MKEPRWIDVRALFLLHTESLAEHGGMPGLRDQPLLESALARPLHLYHYGKRVDVARLAAAYGFGLIRNHPFIDGNKQADFLAVGLFLALNGYDLDMDPVEAGRTIMEVAAGKLGEKGFAQWIRAHMKSAKQRI